MLIASTTLFLRCNMVDTIGSLAYKLRLDSSEFKAGMIATRAEFTAAKAIARDASTGLDSYSRAAKNLDVLLSKGLVNLAQHSAQKEKLTHAYLENEAQVRRLTAAELGHLKTLRDAAAATKTTAQDEANRAKIMQRGRDITEQTRSSQDQLNRSLAEARKLYREGAISAGTYAKHVAELKRNSGTGFLGGINPSVRGTLGAIGAAAGIGSALSIGRDAIRMTADVERASAAMEAFTGSSAKAATMLSEIRKLSSMAGIGFRALNDGASAMMGYGVSTEVTTAKLRQFAEISRGDSDRFKSLALAFGQVNAAGRLMGQEVLQMVNAGFNPLQEIARTTGIEFATLKKMMENGQVSVDMVSKAFDTATSAGGRFNGMLESIGKTSAGALGRLSAEWEQFLDALGKTTPATQGANIAADLLKTGTTVLSQQEDQISRRMDAAKKSGGKGFENFQLFTGYTALGWAAQKNNALDDKIRNSKSYQENLAWEKEKAAAKEAEDKKRKSLEIEEKRVADMNKSAMEKAREARFDAMKATLPEVELKRLERYLSLVDDTTKKQMQLSFLRNKNVAMVGGMLDRSVLDEVRKAEAYDKAKPKKESKAEREADKRSDILAKLKDEGRQIMEKHQSGLTDKQYTFADEVGRLKMLVQQGALDPRVAMRERNQLALKEVDYKPHSGAASMQAGTQEAYKQMISGQLRGENKLLKEQQAMALIAKTQLATQQASERHLRDLNEKLNLETVGS